MKKELNLYSNSIKHAPTKEKGALIPIKTLRTLLTLLAPLYAMRLAFIDLGLYPILFLQALCLLGATLSRFAYFRDQLQRGFATFALLVLSIEIHEVVRDPSLFYYFWCLAPSFIAFVCLGAGLFTGTLVSLILAIFIFLLIYQQELLMPFIATGKSADFLASPPDNETLLLVMLSVQIVILLVIACFRAPFSSNESEVQKRRISRLKTGHRLVLSHTLGRLAHELNNPLAVLDASLSAYERSTKIESERSFLLTHAKDAGERLHRVIDNLKAFMQGDKSEAPATVNVQDLIRQIENRSSEMLASYGVSLKIDDKAQGKSVMCRTQQILFVSLVLIENAAEAMRDIRNPQIKLRIRAQNKRVRFEFEDQGVGIPKDKRDQIFLPFFSSKPTGTLGLSLSTSKVLVEEQHGRMGFQAIESGSRFYFELLTGPSSKTGKEAAHVLPNP